MKIRFVTKDKLTVIKECPEVEFPFSVVMSPMWEGAPQPNGKQPHNFMEHRRYEFRGVVENGIPTVNEA